MTEINGPYNNPISKEMLTDPFWQEPSDFYGGQSFRKAESDALANPSTNMVVTPSDAEADEIISAEIEKYVAGEQTWTKPSPTWTASSRPVSVRRKCPEP